MNEHNTPAAACMWCWN